MKFGCGGPGTVALLTEEFIEGRVGVHDRNHFEVKLDYVLDPHMAANRYLVEGYFFVPRNLGLNPQTYSVGDFYNDISAYIRFKTPTVSLGRLAAQDEDALLARVSRLLMSVRTRPKHSRSRHRLVHELKLFGCILRARLRDFADRVTLQLEGGADREGSRELLLADIAKLCERTFRQLEAALTGYRRLRPDFVAGALPAPIVTTYRAVDEYTSMVSEHYLTELLASFDDHKSNRCTLSGVRTHAKQIILSERGYREQMGYVAVLHAKGKNEHYLYRLGNLKKFVMSVLWLEISKEKEGKRLLDVTAGLAAGTAMFLAVTATIWQSQWFMVNTWGFILAATVTYIFKDRIKEWIKRFFSRKLSGWLADYSVKIRDPESEKQIGRCRESFGFVSASKVPREILACRHRGAEKQQPPEPRDEVILRYEKSIALVGSEVVARLPSDHYDVNDIIRFDISRLLLRMDDPKSVLPLYDDESDAVIPKKLPKTYHVNVVLRLQARGGRRAALQRLRVVLDKRGIRRLEVA